MLSNVCVALWPRHLLERIEREAVWLRSPDFADVFVRRETLEGLQTLCEIVGGDEVGEMASKLVMRFVVEAFDDRLFDRAVSCARADHWSKDAWA